MTTMFIMSISGETVNKSGGVRDTSAMPTQREKKRKKIWAVRCVKVGFSLHHHTWSVSQPVDLSIDDGHLQRRASPPIVLESLSTSSRPKRPELLGSFVSVQFSPTAPTQNVDFV